MASDGLGRDAEEYFMGHKVSGDVEKLYKDLTKVGAEKLAQKARDVFAALDRCLFGEPGASHDAPRRLGHPALFPFGLYEFAELLFGGEAAIVQPVPMGAAVDVAETVHHIPRGTFPGTDMSARFMAISNWRQLAAARSFSSLESRTPAASHR